MPPETEEERALRRLWEGSKGWRAPLGEEPSEEDLTIRSDLSVTQRGNRTRIVDTRPLEEVNPGLARFYKSLEGEFSDTFLDNLLKEKP